MSSTLKPPHGESCVACRVYGVAHEPVRVTPDGELHGPRLRLWLDSRDAFFARARAAVGVKGRHAAGFERLAQPGGTMRNDARNNAADIQNPNTPPSQNPPLPTRDESTVDDDELIGGAANTTTSGGSRSHFDPDVDDESLGSSER